MIDLLLIIVALVLVAACGVFVAAEFSLITVNRVTVERLADKGDRRAASVHQALRTLSTQLSGAQVGITVTNLAIGFLIEPAVASLIEAPLAAIGVPEGAVPTVAVLTGVALATTVTMVFGELVPKNLAIARPLATARLVAGMQRTFSRIAMYPITLLNGSANFILRRMGIEPQEELASARSAEELTSLVRRSAEKGTLPKETALMLERSLTFGERNAVDVMTPRVRVRSVRATDTMVEVLRQAGRSGLSRFPVIRESLDDVAGIVHIKQALAVPSADRKRITAEQIMTKPLAVPASMQLEPLLDTLRSAGLHMALVIDEFGGTDGIVTIEDLLEELVGEVQDEHDRRGSMVHKRDDGSWALSGLLRLDEVTQRLGFVLPGNDDEIETLGGLIADRLERVPVVRDHVTVKATDQDGQQCRVHLRVERMDGRRVDRVRLQAMARKQTTGDDSEAGL